MTLDRHFSVQKEFTKYYTLLALSIMARQRLLIDTTYLLRRCCCWIFPLSRITSRSGSCKFCCWGRTRSYFFNRSHTRPIGFNLDAPLCDYLDWLATVKVTPKESGLSYIKINYYCFKPTPVFIIFARIKKALYRNIKTWPTAYNVV